jgi:hypothetical protein
MSTNCAPISPAYQSAFRKTFTTTYDATVGMPNQTTNCMANHAAHWTANEWTF